MKNYIIAGVPLAGKSTLSNHLHKKYNLNHIVTDGFVSAFENVFPNIGIKHGFGLTVEGYNDVCKKTTDFSLSFIKELEEQNTYNNYIIEGCHWRLDKLTQLKNTHKIIILGYPDISCEEKFDMVRKFDKNNRTNKVSDKELKNIIFFWISISKVLQKKSLEHDFKFINTGLEYQNIFLF